MASAVVGAAVIRILPETTGFAGKVRREMQSAAQGASRPFRDLGFNIKRQLTSAFSAGLASLNNLKAGAQSLSRFFARNFTIPIGIALGAITKLTTEFESGMLRVEALTTRAGDSVAQVTQRMEALSATARELGRTTEFTANQASEAMQNFALAGFDANEIMVSTEATLSLASAGQVDLAQASDITATAIRGFNLEADDAGRVADVMTQTFTNSNTDLQQLGQGFKFVAPVAAAAGLTFEETSAALGILSNAGLKASLAGTSLRGIITKLINPSAKAKGIIEELGIEVFDAAGNMRPLVDIVQQFEGSMRDFGLELRDDNGKVKDLNDVLAEAAAAGGNVAGVFETITGLDSAQFLEESAQDFKDIGVNVFDTNGTLKSFNQVIGDSRENAVTASQAMAIFAQRAGPGMLALVSQGSGALEELTNKNLDAAGRAAEIQAKQMEGLRGSFLLVKSAAEGLGIEIGLTFAESLSESARGVADFINMITDWVVANEALTAQIVKVASALAALGPGFFLVSKALGLIITTFTTLLSPVRLIGVALVGLGVFFQRMINNSEALRVALQQTFEIFKAFAGPVLTLFGSIIGDVAGDVDGLATALGDRLAGVVENFNKGLKELAENEGIQKFMQSLAEGFLKVKEFILTTGRAAAGNIFDFLVDAAENLVSVFEALLPLFEGFIGFITGEFVQGIAGLAVDALGTFLDALGAIADFLKPLTTLIGRNFTPVIVALGSAFIALKVKAIQFGAAATTAGASVKAGLIAPLQTVSTSLLTGSLRLDTMGAKLEASASKMGRFGGAARGAAAATRGASAGLLTAADRADKMAQRTDLARKALVGLTTAIAGFSLGKMIAEAEDLEGRMIGLGSALSNIAIATAIGGPLAGSLAAFATIIGQVSSLLKDAPADTFRVIDATDELRVAFSDFNLTAKETLSIFRDVFNEISATGGRDMHTMLRQIGQLDVAGSNFRSTLSELAIAASDSNDAFEDVFDNILTNALRLRVQGARDLGAFADIFDDIIDKSRFTEDPFGLGNLSVGALFKNDADRFDSEAFETAKLRASDLFAQLLELDDGSLNLSVGFSEVKDGALEVGDAFLTFKAQGEQAEGMLAELNALGVDFNEISFEKLFPGQEEAARGLISMQEFGIEIDNARIAAELARPAMEEAARAEEILLEATKPLAASFNDVAGAINNAANELGLLSEDPVDGARRLLDTLSGVESGIGRFSDEGAFPDFATLFNSATGEGEQFRNFLDGVANDVDTTLIAKAVEAKGDVDKLTESFAEVRAGLEETFLEAGVDEDFIPGLLDLLTAESATLKFTPELLLGTNQVKDAQDELDEALKKRNDKRAEALGLDPGQLFIPTGEFSPEFKEHLRKQASLAFADGFRTIEATTIPVAFDAVDDIGLLLSGGLNVLEDGQVEVPAVTIPTSLATSPLIRDLKNRDLGIEIVNAALAGEESVTIPVTSAILSDLELLDSGTVRDQLASLGAQLGVIDLTGASFDPAAMVETLNEIIETEGEEEGKLWAEAFARGIDLAELSPAVQDMLSKIEDPIEQSKALDILRGGGLPGIGDFNTPTGSSGIAIAQSEIDRIIGNYGGAATEVESASTRIANSNLEISESIAGLVSSSAAVPQILTSTLAQTAASIGTQVALFKSAFWNPFAVTITSAAAALGLSLGISEMHHTGGIAGDPSARKPETGGPRNDEVVALLQKGEGILPRDVMNKMTRDQFEALRTGKLDPESTFDPRDEMGDPFLSGTLAALGQASQVGTSVNSISQSSLDAVLAATTGSISSIFGTGNRGLGATIMAEAARETAQAAYDFLTAANAQIGRIFIAKYGNVAAWPVGTTFGGGSRQDDLSQEVDFLQQMKGQANSFPALLTYLRATGTPFRVTSAIRNSLVRGTFIPSLHNFGRAVDLGTPTPSVDSDGLRAIYDAFDPVAGIIRSRIYSGPGGGGFGEKGSITWQDHHDHVHLALANGAIIRERVLAELGEAGDEVVIPLDRPERAMALALQSGLFDTLARSTQSSPPSVGAATTASRGSTVGGNFDGGPLGGGPGNTYHLVGVGLEQVKAEIAARDEAMVRVRR